MYGFALLLSALIGLSLGLLGSGGSIITLPVLVYVAGVPAHQAVGMSLVIVGGTSIVGTLLNLRRGSLDLRAGSFFALSGMVGAFIGARFTHLVSASVLMLLFGILMLAVGGWMLGPNDLATPSRSCQPIRCLTAGITVGLLTGFLGVGGGFLILPALVLFAGLDMKTAIGTSLAVIAVNCVGGLFGQLRFIDIDWLLTLLFLAIAVAGMFGGALLAGWLSAATLRPGFAWCVAFLGMALVVRNLEGATLQNERPSKGL
jgi:uncharacterized membrane protein YfcA